MLVCHSFIHISTKVMRLAWSLTSASLSGDMRRSNKFRKSEGDLFTGASLSDGPINSDYLKKCRVTWSLAHDPLRSHKFPSANNPRKGKGDLFTGASLAAPRPQLEEQLSNPSLAARTPQALAPLLCTNVSAIQIQISKLKQ